jgi:thiamine kinase-like enzyme
VIQDYEYASYNPIAYDLANHFCEMAADYHSDTPHVLDYSKYPGKVFVLILTFPKLFVSFVFIDIILSCKHTNLYMVKQNSRSVKGLFAPIWVLKVS